MFPGQFFRRWLMAAVACLLTVQASVASASLLTLQPGVTPAKPGEAISLDLVVSGLADTGAPSLGAFDITVTFDPSVLAFSGYHLGGLLGDPGVFEAIDISAGAGLGSVNIAELSFLSATTLDALQPAAFILASLTFDVADLVPGTLTRVTVSTASELVSALGASLAISQYGSADVSVSVPIPGTLALIVGAMLGWLVIGTARSTAVCRQQACLHGR